jgi:hypothetical protein
MAGASRFWLKHCNSLAKVALDGCAVPPINGLRTHQDEGGIQPDQIRRVKAQNNLSITGTLAVN